MNVKCFEDNSKVKELAGTAAKGRVMVVDGGGSLRRALLATRLETMRSPMDGPDLSFMGQSVM